MKSFKRQFIEKWIGNEYTSDKAYDPLEQELLEAIEKDDGASRFSTEEIDLFAMRFSTWLLYDPIAIGLRESGMKAGKLLDTYKDRPYINTDTSKQ